MKTRIAMLAAIAMAATLPPAQAGIGEELTIAQTHSLLAYRTGGRGAERALPHLQHVLNCLVGPGGEGYNITPPFASVMRRIGFRHKSQERRPEKYKRAGATT